MKTSFKYLVGNAKRLAGMALVAGSLLLTGCASGINGTTQTSAAPHVRADVIYVYSFNATPEQVKMDSGIAQKIGSAISGESSAQKQVQTAIDTREQVANEIVRELQSMGCTRCAWMAPHRRTRTRWSSKAASRRSTKASVAVAS